MAEAIGVVSVAASVLAAIQISNDLVRILRAVSLTDDPRVKLIKYNLMTQRALTIAWANRLRSESSETWNIPPESARDVEQILSEMNTYFSRAEAKMDKIYKAPDGKMTSRLFIRRFLFVNGGFQELKDLTEALDSMNKTLLVIAPPPPSYSPQVGASINVAPLNPSVEISEIDQSGETENIDPLYTADLPAPHVSIHALYALCLETLGSICASTGQEQTFENQHDRLKLWGTGIFTDGPLAVDQILMTEPQRQQNFRETLVRTLVYVAVSEEAILKSLCMRKEGEQQQRLARQRTALLAILGRDPLSEIALERWKTILENEQEKITAFRSSSRPLSFTTESTDTKQDLAFRRKEESAKDHLPSFSLDSDQRLDSFRFSSRKIIDLAAIERETHILERTVSTSLKKELASEGRQTTGDQLEIEDDQGETVRLGKTIEMLFDLLPTIRRIRRTRILRQESRDLKNVEVTMHESSSMTSTTEIPATTSDSGLATSLGLTFDQLLDHSLNLASSLETVLQNDENWAKKNGEKVEAYSGILRKETDRLREFKKAKESNRDSGDMQLVISTIATLGKALNETIKDIAVSEKPKISEKTSSRIHLIDAKSADDRDEKIKALVKIFGVYNSKMWEQSDRPAEHEIQALRPKHQKGTFVQPTTTQQLRYL